MLYNLFQNLYIMSYNFWHLDLAARELLPYPSIFDILNQKILSNINIYSKFYEIVMDEKI